jgi:peroxiredoxin
MIEPVRRLDCWFVIVIVTVVLLYSFDNKSVEAADIGSKAPPFTLVDLQGNTVSLSDFQGRMVIIDFWATYCHVCEDTSLILEKIHRKYKEQGLVLLGISLDEGKKGIEDVKNFIRKFDLTFTVLMGNRTVAKQYFSIGIPTTFILDKDHVIVEKYIGDVFYFDEEMFTLIEKHLEVKK